MCIYSRLFRALGAHSGSHTCAWGHKPLSRILLAVQQVNHDLARRAYADICFYVCMHEFWFVGLSQDGELSDMFSLRDCQVHTMLHGDQR